MNKVDWEALRKDMEENEYPPNQMFDPENVDDLPYCNSRMDTIKRLFPEISYKNFGSLLDVGCNRGLFSFSFRDCFNEILGIDPIKNMIEIAQKIRTAHGLGHIEFFTSTFENFNVGDTIKFDVVHFGQCSHYLFRDEIRRGDKPLSFLRKAKSMARRYIMLDSAFDGDPSVEYDAEHDNWIETVRKLATIEGYAVALRPEFRLIRYGHSGDPKGSTRYLAVFERIIKKEDPCQ